jgi:hypothetical protein
MPSRRVIVKGLIGAGLFLPSNIGEAFATEAFLFKGDKVFSDIVAKATTNKWVQLPIGQLVGKLAMEFVGYPYVGGTLDSSADREQCTVDLNAFDCVTFFETSLGLARMLRKGGRTPADLMKEVTFTRYRSGKATDYASRLHYTTDWFADNQAKKVVRLLSDLPGAEEFRQKVTFMSSHPQAYKQLSAHSNLIKKIAAVEEQINSRRLTFVPLQKLAQAEPFLQTGDIVGVCTSMQGLDITHTGLVINDESGTARFLDASSSKSKMKVTLEPGRLSAALSWSSQITGAMFARPLEPRKP